MSYANFRRELGAGDFDRRITVELNTPTRSASGALVPSWASFTQRWAKMFNSGSREVYRARQFLPETMWVFVCPGRMAITQDMRITHDGRLFDILGVQSPDGKSPDKADMLEISAKEGVSKGT